MESINTNNSQAVKNYQPPKAATAQTTEAPKAKAIVVPKFISPNGNIDAKSGTYTIQVRDTSTGEVKSEYPRKIATQEYSKPAKQEQTQTSNNGPSVETAQPESTGAGTNAEGLNLKI